MREFKTYHNFSHMGHALSWLFKRSAQGDLLPDECYPMHNGLLRHTYCGLYEEEEEA